MAGDKIMQLSLFEPKSKKEMVYQFIKERGHARTSDVIKFGSAIYHNRAEKDARDLANIKYTNPPKLRRMTEFEKHSWYGPNIGEDVWVVV
jgi:hypothetical protein